MPVPLVPVGVVTVMSTTPAPAAGAVAVIDVAELTVKAVAFVAPKRTAVAPLRLVPVMATEVPPAVDPLAGLTPDTAGSVPPQTTTTGTEAAWAFAAPALETKPT